MPPGPTGNMTLVSQAELLPTVFDLVCKPQAGTGPGVIDALLSALEGAPSPYPTSSCAGYAESGDADEVAVRGSHLGPRQMRELSATLEPLTDLHHVEHSGLHLPTHVWSFDRQLVITCPMFSDSLYISSPTLTGR